MTGSEDERAGGRAAGPPDGEGDPLTRIAQGGAAMGAEMAGFAARRVRAADAARRRMLACRSMAEIGAVQAGYAQEAAADYMRHLGVLGDLGASTVRGTMAAGATSAGTAPGMTRSPAAGGPAAADDEALRGAAGGGPAPASAAAAAAAGETRHPVDEADEVHAKSAPTDGPPPEGQGTSVPQDARRRL